MMPADLLYVLSSQQQRNAMNAARAKRIAAAEAADALARTRKEAARAARATPRRRQGWARLLVRRARGCTP
jgi:hypothetical protein